MQLRSMLCVHGRLLLCSRGAGDEGLLIDAVLRGCLAAADALCHELAVHLGAMQAVR